ncbi:hypothetical protein [Sinorhizobium meliloti]|uniref:hypothetical protein n=1 Tax=Rhizobium meliloti TaxID=382 RepID=UPI000FD49391|nr:hypothetical protein [Sinorhizobium meliloti]RVM09362.1 hypothetical protein CN125_14110 [Sinorhizobium meliloti]RVM50000.1 hypothetical protein CN121_07480 [Sinorhizobium meliloti]RVM66783.1 hypothetical protein CN124_13395 [Sinorhizobium meliloti]RVM72986.1 hypothetical protein CN123_02895 [Sinorhizobium meliloti]RVM87620.1 hypothetical protein CN117_05175 [Sinorhizobium meliloti]
MLSQAAPALTNLELNGYLERLRPFVDDTIEKLGSASFREDPIAGRKYSRATSIISSAYKRHGAILDQALLERLKDCARLRVWTEDDFKLSHESLQRVRITERVEPLLATELPYGDRERAIRVDIIVFDEERRSLTSYNVKRGNGSYDGGKRRMIQEDLVRTHMLLSDYGRTRGMEPSRSHSHIIFYYGLLSLPAPLAIPGKDLDEHFDFPVMEAIERVNSYFVERLHALIEEGT